MSVETTIATLTAMMHRLRSVLDLESSLQIVADTTKSLVPCDGASVRLFDSKREGFLAVARAGESVHAKSAVRLRADMGLIGWVGRHGRPAMVNDTDEDERFESNPDQVMRVRSIVCVPLIIGERVLGVLGATARSSKAFSEAHFETLKFLGDCAAPWIELSRLEALSIRDPLTGLYNRRYLDGRLIQEIGRARRHGHRFSLTMLDLNSFKSINDTYGHVVGDVVLRTVAMRLQNSLRIDDIICRFGGDEFAVLMPETDLVAAQQATERVLEAIGAHPIDLTSDYGVRLAIVAAGGVAELREEDSAETLLDRADRQMFLNKRESHAAKAPLESGDG
ncbi:MAG: sensor domain-containing diguanylate cyclase [Myxococcales bacterium]|nr:sensor domain-containing diguanylate cyclase [Myxococcales bacterium]